MKIKHKLLGLTGISVSALLLSLTLSWFANERVAAIDRATLTVSELEVTLLNLRRNEKDFLARFDIKYQGQFNENTALFEQQLASLNRNVTELELQLVHMDTLPQFIQNYQQGMMAMIAGYQVLGLTSQQGLNLAFEQAAEALQQSASRQLDAQAIFSLIQDAKLFTATQNLAYFQDYQTAYQQELELVGARVKTPLVAFNNALEQVVAQNKIVGLDHKSGLRGDIRQQSHQLEQAFNEMSVQLHEIAETQRQDIMTVTIIAVLIVIAALLALSMFISQSIQQRISAMSKLMSDIATSHDLTYRADESGRDEISDMAVNFNYLLTGLRQLVSDVQTAITELGAASEQLQRRSRDTESAMAQQQAETDSVATAVTEMGVTIREIAMNTETAAGNAHSSHQGATEGLQEVNMTKTRIRQLSDDLAQTSDEIANLSGLSDNIGSVLDVIKGIAEQTNLLALNAAIEAARAGEQGRGFAVVADEVRTLALRTRQSTEEITTIIGSLQGQTEQVVAHISRCREQGDMSVEQVDNAEQKISQIMTDMQAIMDTSTQIATAVEEQSHVSNEVAQNVTVIRDITTSNAEISHENAQAANAVADQAQGLAKAIAHYQA
ncbi:methyl-accepting chemotaxis protein [Photobacterium swingsii]|uniref:methyl-accepting chemotaxis protein n=1 Tax=Photobacterium swingsii TaxID=680026 RepID=UPI003D1372CB